jgi:hypothetical protein
MLDGGQADSVTVVYRALRLVSVACCLLVVMSFAMFADDQLSTASRHQQNELVTSATPATTASNQTHQRGQPGRFIDGAASELTAPFRMIVESANLWVQHGLETVFALAVYGLGLGFLARYSRV